MLGRRAETLKRFPKKGERKGSWGRCFQRGSLTGASKAGACASDRRKKKTRAWAPRGKKKQRGKRLTKRISLAVPAKKKRKERIRAAIVSVFQEKGGNRRQI